MTSFTDEQKERQRKFRSVLLMGFASVEDIAAAVLAENSLLDNEDKNDISE